MVSHASFRRSPQYALERRRQELERVDNSSIKHTVVTGTVKVKGSGEVTVDFDFPVQFVEKPTFTFGAELGMNHSPVAGSFPVSSATVVGWNLKEKSDQRKYYIGCTLAVVALGATDQRVLIHCVFQGKAFRSPGNSGASDIGDTL